MAFTNDPTVLTGLTAATTQTQAGALASTAGNGAVLNGTHNVIGTCANSGDAVLIPSGLSKGAEIRVRNGGANPAAVFPPVGGTIDAGSANASKTLTNAKGMLFFCTSSDGLTWVTIAGA